MPWDAATGLDWAAIASEAVRSFVETSGLWIGFALASDGRSSGADLISDHRQVGEGSRESSDFHDGVVGGGEASGGIVQGQEGAGAVGIGKGEGGSPVGSK